METGPHPILKTDALSREVAGVCIVDQISIEVCRGDVLAIAGPSGAGKSSFLRLLNRLDEPTAGTFFVEGTDYRDMAPPELRRRLGMVMQTAYLFPGTVSDNLRFGPRQRGEELSSGRIAHLLEQVGMAGYAERSVANLSGGEAQRVSLARTLANAPLLLLLDEPTSALDEDSKRTVETSICHVIQENALTCLIVTHDMRQAARIAKRVMIMRSGRLLRIGPVEEVLHAEGMVK